MTEHARQELEKAGMFDKDCDYNGALGNAVMELIEVFAERGHSGFSAMMTIDLFATLAKQENLTELTSDPNERIDRSDISNEPMWQNKRRGSTFSRDGGKTWYDVDNSELNKGDVWERVTKSD